MSGRDLRHGAGGFAADPVIVHQRRRLVCDQAPPPRVGRSAMSGRAAHVVVSVGASLIVAAGPAAFPFLDRIRSRWPVGAPTRGVPPASPLTVHRWGSTTRIVLNGRS